MSERIRYTVQDVQNDQFFQMPKFLFQGEFKGLSNDARVLYALLKDRHKLSVENKWINGKNEVYLIYSRVNMEEMLGVSDKTTKKAVDQLIKYKLMEEERQGQGKPNLIYLMAVTVGNTKTRKNYDFSNGSLTSQESEEIRPSNTNVNNTYFIQTENQYIYQADDRPIDVFTHILDNLKLDQLKIAYPTESDLIDEIELNVKEMIACKEIVICKKSIPRSLIINAMQKLRYWHIAAVIDKYKEIVPNKKIGNHKSYMQSMLYNIAYDFNAMVDNEVRYALSNKPK